MIPTWAKLAALAALLSALVGVGAYLNGARWEAKYDKLQASYNTFKGGVAALGEKAKADNAKQALSDLKNKEKTDDENKRTIATLRADVKRLRLEADRARGSGVPAAPAGASRPDLACFDRAAFESAYGELTAEVRGGADEGTEATVNLDDAKVWNSTREKIK